MKTHILHHDSLQGFGAAFAAWLKLGDAATYRPLHYGQAAPVLESGIQYDIRHHTATSAW